MDLSSVASLVDGTSVDLFGMLVRDVNGLLTLEDPYGSIQLNLENCTSSDGFLYSEGSMVVASGCISTDAKTLRILQVTSLQMPRTIGPRDPHVAFTTHPTFTGASIKVASAADVWLDQFDVLSRLDRALNHLSSPFNVVVLFGRFLRDPPPAGPRAFAAYRSAFASLAKIVKPLRHRIKLILVPSLEDTAGLHSVLPQPRPPNALYDSSLLTLTSNPCRLFVDSRQYLLIRDDLGCKLARNSLNLPATEPSLPQHQLVPFTWLLCIDGRNGAGTGTLATVCAGDTGRLVVC